jgi:hypothetical protein
MLGEAQRDHLGFFCNLKCALVSHSVTPDCHPYGRYELVAVSGFRIDHVVVEHSRCILGVISVVLISLCICFVQGSRCDGFMLMPALIFTFAEKARNNLSIISLAVDIVEVTFISCGP